MKIKIEPRDYQLRIVKAVGEKNSLIVLPTGLGKTVIAIMVMDRHLEGRRKVLFLAPTKPLVDQHHSTILRITNLLEDEVASLTGAVSPIKRERLWKGAKVVVATPQTIKNDMMGGRFSLEDFGLVIFDECHRAVGEYAYTFIAEECKRRGVQIIGLTASPGGKREKIDKVVETLGIAHVEIRDERDEDVKGYVKGFSFEWVEVELPDEMREIKKDVEEALREQLRTLKKLNLIRRATPNIPKTELLDLRRKIESKNWSNKYMKYNALSYHASAMKLSHALELLETQGVSTFLDYMKRLMEREDTKALKRIFRDHRIRRALSMAERFKGKHPKMEKLLEVLEERKDDKVIVFVQYRAQVKRLVDELVRHGFSARMFVGKREGITQKDQRRTIDDFRRGLFNIMVASSIGEEGLDIPAVDTVIFYEPVPSEIRSIQRRGRAGRTKAGKIIVLITKKTRDEAYYWAAKKKERKMKSMMKRLSSRGKRNQSRLSDFW